MSLLGPWRELAGLLQGHTLFVNSQLGVIILIGLPAFTGKLKVTSADFLFNTALFFFVLLNYVKVDVTVVIGFDSSFPIRSKIRAWAWTLDVRHFDFLHPHPRGISCIG
jgi:hypothetical protein